MCIPECQTWTGEHIQIVRGILLIMGQQGITAFIRSALPEHLVEVFDSACPVVRLLLHKLVRYSELQSALVVEGNVRPVFLFQRVEFPPARGGVHVLLHVRKNEVQALYFIINKDVAFRVGSHSLIHQSAGKLRIILAKQRNTTLV